MSKLRGNYKARHLLLLVAVLSIPLCWFFMTQHINVQVKFNDDSGICSAIVCTANSTYRTTDALEPYRTVGVTVSAALAVISIGGFIYLTIRHRQ